MFRFIKISVQLFVVMVFLLPLTNVRAENSSPVSGRALDVNSILPADVLARTNLLTEQLQLIRAEMGKPEKLFQSVEVVNAAPREVYFQAMALFNKVNRLAFEQTGFSEQIPKQVDATLIRPYHVWQMMEHALQRVLVVKETLQIPENIQEHEETIDTRPDHVYSAVVKANRLTNSLLQQRFSPSDVYQQISVSIYTMAQLLAGFENIERLPAASVFERRKRPMDVYQRLLECHEWLGKIAQLSDIHFLGFSDRGHLADNIEPSDVYDLSALLVADISHFHALRKNADAVSKAYYPGFKTPSHVYQRASILLQQLESLFRAIKKNPAWLSQ